jgi:hypothetical protein
MTDIIRRDKAEPIDRGVSSAAVLRETRHAQRRELGGNFMWCWPRNKSAWLSGGARLGDDRLSTDRERFQEHVQGDVAPFSLWGASSKTGQPHEGT